MQLVERSVLVLYTPAQMFALVDDIARYPEFLPWCVGASVQKIDANERLATLNVARGVLRTNFTTRNTLSPDREIAMRLVQGPFKELSGRWTFAPIGDSGTRVTFRVEFEFKSTLAAMALSSAFEAICNAMVDAFAARARKIYG